MQDQQLKTLINKSSIESHYLESSWVEYCYLNEEDKRDLIKQRIASAITRFIMEKMPLLVEEVKELNAIKYTVKGYFFTPKELQDLIKYLQAEERINE